MEQLRFGKIQSKLSLKFDKTSDQALHIYNAVKRVLLHRRRTGEIMAKRALKCRHFSVPLLVHCRAFLQVVKRVTESSQGKSLHLASESLKLSRVQKPFQQKDNLSRNELGQNCSDPEYSTAELHFRCNSEPFFFS
jgi:hypothetical protein